MTIPVATNTIMKTVVANRYQKMSDSSCVGAGGTGGGAAVGVAPGAGVLGELCCIGVSRPTVQLHQQHYDEQPSQQHTERDQHEAP